jgi:hypothetical protein
MTTVALDDPALPELKAQSHARYRQMRLQVAALLATSPLGLVDRQQLAASIRRVSGEPRSLVTQRVGKILKEFELHGWVTRAERVVSVRDREELVATARGDRPFLGLHGRYGPGGLPLDRD